MSHSRLAVEKCRLFWMVGRATLTMVASSTIINWAAEITTKASPRCFPAVLESPRPDSAVTTADVNEMPPAQPRPPDRCPVRFPSPWQSCPQAKQSQAVSDGL